EIVTALGPARKPQLAGYCTRIIDGRHLTSTDHWLKALRYTRSGPLPGQALPILDPDRMLIVDLFPCEDGEAQERRILPEVIPSAREREHASTLTWEQETKAKKIGRCETGMIYEQKLLLQDGEQT